MQETECLLMIEYYGKYKIVFRIGKKSKNTVSSGLLFSMSLMRRWITSLRQLPDRIGDPSHDTLNRIFSLINPGIFEQLFTQWVQSFRDTKVSGEVIAVDGKTMRGSKDSYHDQRI